MSFALILLIALVVTGVIWAVDRVLFAPSRRKAVLSLEQTGAAIEAVQDAGKEPVLVEYSRAFFPVILVVFLVRGFVVEPFRIPSGSMEPTLRIGDFILVNKFDYGLRLPVLNRKIIAVGEPKRGDVMVFRYPGNPSVDYIKRVVGLPGDHIVYNDKKLYINGKLMPQTADGQFVYSEGRQHGIVSRKVREDLDGVVHDILLSSRPQQAPMEFTVPPGQYFVMGDNRDRSWDSRYWGTVPEKNIVGKAFMIWFSWDVASDGGVRWSRIGRIIH